MGLCAIGMGIGTWLRDILDYDNEDDCKLIIIAGAAAAFGTLFPSPILAVLFIVEISVPPKDYMEHICVLGFAAIVGWVCMHAMQSNSMGALTRNGRELGEEWNWKFIHVLYAVLFGLFSSLIGLLSMAIRILCKQIFVRIRIMLAPRKLLMQIVPNALGGAVLGVTMYALPLTIGFGNLQQTYLIKFASTEDVAFSLLVKTIFFRLLSLGVSMTSGFRGGPFHNTYVSRYFNRLLCLSSF
jgi:H+/Cl- antiporter ClcA